MPANDPDTTDPSTGEGTERPRILVPLRVLEGESLPEGVPGLLANAHVVLLGYHVIPEQTAPGQARMQFEDRAIARLDEFEEMLEAAGATVERRLVFTHEGQKTIDRLIYEHDCLAVLVPHATGVVEDVLVPIRGAVGVDRIARIVGGLFGESDAVVTLLHVAEDGEEGRDLLDGTRDRLAEFGVEASRVETRIETDAGPIDAIVDAAEAFDAIVIGESDPSIATFVFGMTADQVADRFLGPVFVVQRERPAENEDPGKNEEADGEG